ncbi:MAG TPA: NnrS family protein, partial [Rhizobiales bacterium]|nr:NnrS family protein [Hyphomicrobiales bacterium]
PILGVAYLLVAVSALTRAVLPGLMPDSYDLWIYLSAGLWLAAFAIFVIAYFPILTRPRLQK